MIWLVVIAVVWLILATVNECYNLQIASFRTQVVPRLLLTTMEAGGIYLVIFFVFGRPKASDSPLAVLSTPVMSFYDAPRITPVLFLLVALPMIWLWRLGYIRFFTSPALRRRAVVVGAGKAGRKLVHAVRESSQDYDILGYIDDDQEKRGVSVDRLPVLGTRYDLVRLVRSQRVDEVILAITHDVHHDLLKALMDCHEEGTPIKPMSVFYEQALGQVPVEHLRQKWFPVPPWGQSSTPTIYRAIKRLTDIICALLGLAVFSVLFPFVVLAIKLDDGGPIFYSQERAGQGGRVFKLVKFRSMIQNAERGGQAVWASRSDPRITRVGYFLRRTRIDEFPQLFNVLTGEMSIVGPRPERPQFVQQLQEQVPFYRSRLVVKPGLTGWAQIKYSYGNSVEDALIKLQYDLYYIKYRSLMLDSLIILRTINVMVTFKGT